MKGSFLDGPGGKQLGLSKQNESSSKHERFLLKESEKWSLKDCNLRQLKMLNEKLDDYQEKPYAFSEPRKRYVPSPDLRPEAIESLEPH